MGAEAGVLRDNDIGAEIFGNSLDRDILPVDGLAFQPAGEHQRRYGREEPVSEGQTGDKKSKRHDNGEEDAENGSG